MSVATDWRGEGAGASQANELPPTAQLLSLGGDSRIAVDAASGVNRYHCPATPSDAACFGSSTASAISQPAFEAADQLRTRLQAALAREDTCDIYHRELARVRRELTVLCGLDDMPGMQTLFAASGTDAHLLAAHLVAGMSHAPTIAVTVEAAETGGGVGLALTGRHFGPLAALGRAVRQGDLAAGPAIRSLLTVDAREPDGRPRPVSDIRDDLVRTVNDLTSDRRLLVTVADVTKTGLISLDIAQVLDLRRRFEGRIEVLIDACQFRLSPAGLRAYLDAGAMVAVTGSKFVGGPSFSGALFTPARLAARFAGQPLNPALGAYCARADLPDGWVGAAGLPNVANFGLLLRWEAALAELRAFRAVPEWQIARGLQVFAATVTARISASPALEMLAAPQLDRRALGEGRWDSLRTIFPFLLRHTQGWRPGRYFTPEETARLYRDAAALGLQLGQPVSCGVRDGAPISALRICSSAPLLVEATAQGCRNLATVLDRIGAAFDTIDRLARAMSAEADAGATPQIRHPA